MNNYVKRIIRGYLEDRRLKGRYREGNNDLQKGLSKGNPISWDQKKEIVDFWKPFLFNKFAKKSFDIRWFNIYNRTNVFDFDLKYYIPDGYYYRIVDVFFNDPKKAPVLDDKNLYDLYFGDAPQPKSICRKIYGIYLDADYHQISEEKAVDLCLDAGEVIIKESIESMSGSGVTYCNSSKCDKSEVRGFLSEKQCAVVQEAVKQHKVLSDFNDSCVNTLRLVTLLFEGEVQVVASVVIMGGKNAKTNHLHRGGIVCGILPNGRLRDTAFDGKLNIYKTHPNGVDFADVTLPNYEKCLSLVKFLAPRFAGVSRLISWDLTIRDNGEPVIIETNLYYGGSVQIADGPVFGELTPVVLEYIKKNSI
jgi:hypothetical protein